MMEGHILQSKFSQLRSVCHPFFRILSKRCFCWKPAWQTLWFSPVIPPGPSRSTWWSHFRLRLPWLDRSSSWLDKSSWNNARIQYSGHGRTGISQIYDTYLVASAPYTRRSQQYLMKHADSVFRLDTRTTTWKEFSHTQFLSNPWSKVTSKLKKSKKTNPSKYSVSAAQLLGNRSKPGTIAGEISKASTLSEPRGQKCSANHDDNSAASDGKQSVLISTLNVPVCDGTYGVTLRWKTHLDMNLASESRTKMKHATSSMMSLMMTTDFYTNGTTLEPTSTTWSPKWCQMKSNSTLAPPSVFYHPSPWLSFPFALVFPVTLPENGEIQRLQKRN